MPAPKILDISGFGKREVKRTVEVMVETGETDIGRKIVSPREEVRAFVEITPWCTVPEIVLMHNELGPFDWKPWHEGGMATGVYNGVTRRRFCLSDEDYAEFQKRIAAKKAEVNAKTK